MLFVWTSQPWEGRCTKLQR